MANIDWENLPSTTTPINATNLNKISAGIVNIGTSVDSSYRTNILKGKNLFDKNNVSLFVNGWIDTTTMRLNTANGNRMFYLPCKPNTTYTISRSVITSTFRATTYNSTPFPSATNSNVDYTVSTVQQNNDGTSITITTGANAKYLVVHYGKQEDTNLQASLDTIQVEEGSIATTYEAFVPNSIYVNDTKFTETIGVGTSANSANRVNVLHSKNLLDYNTSVNGVFTVNSTSETLDTNNTAITSAWIPCEPNTTYRLYNPNDTSARKRWQTKASNGTITYMGETNTITTNSTAKYMRVYYYVGSSATSPSSITNVQIEKGSEFTGFEPYITPSIVVDNDEIYQKGTLVWQNNDVSPTSIFNSQNITLSQNWEKLLIVCRSNYNDTTQITIPVVKGIGRNFTLSNAVFNYSSSKGSGIRVVSRFCSYGENDDKILTIGQCYGQDIYGSSTDSISNLQSFLVPYKIYKI